MKWFKRKPVTIQAAFSSDEIKASYSYSVPAILQNRFALLAFFFCFALLAIQVKTSWLQLFAPNRSGIVESTRFANQIKIEGKRGDIVDAHGTVLAYTTESQDLYLSYVEESNQALNSRLLEIINLLEQNGVQYENEFAKYVKISQAKSDEKDKTTMQFEFAKDEEEIIAWQKNRDLFDLNEPKPNATIPVGAPVVRRDANEFFHYLCFDFFKLENKEAVGRRYSDAEAYKIISLRYILLTQNWTYRHGEPVLIARNINQSMIESLREQNYRYRGVVIAENGRRQYAKDASYYPHVLGYVGRISPSEYASNRSFGYAPNSIVGVSGVEAYAERYLHGNSSYATYNTFGVDNATSPLSDRSSTSPQDLTGNKVRLTLDTRLQQVATKQLETMITSFREGKMTPSGTKYGADNGCVVMMNAKTGAILAMASYPTFEASDFVTQEFDREALARVEGYLKDSKNKPLLNRAIGEIYPPGSTFKPVTAMAALQNKTITPNSNTFICRGQDEIGEWKWFCLERPVGGHGPLTLDQGLTTSCNLYFYQLGVATGIDAISKTAAELGLGERSGIDLYGESRGILASREEKRLTRERIEDQTWFPANTCQASIGQFDNTFTILQMARAIGAVGSGKLVTPHVIKEVTNVRGEVVRPEQIAAKDLGYDQSYIDIIRRGMFNLTQTRDNDTSYFFSNFVVPVAAKTGTAQVGYGDKMIDNAMYVCYAPANDPEVVVVSAVANTTFGDTTSGLAYSLLKTYFTEVAPR